MDKRLFWRAALTQLVVVAVPFAILAVTVGEKFFRHNGIWAGPLAWIVCSAITARILKLELPLAIVAAAAGGVCAGIVTVAGAPHAVALPVAVGVFGACCGGYETALRELEASEKKQEPASPDGAPDQHPERTPASSLADD
jgi:hypothetical protein